MNRGNVYLTSLVSDTSTDQNSSYSDQIGLSFTIVEVGAWQARYQEGARGTKAPPPPHYGPKVSKMAHNFGYVLQIIT